MGYFLEDFVNHMFYKERASDFWEMFLHHSMTLTLISGTILQNFMRCGTVVLYLHMVPDAVNTFARVLSQTHYKNATIASFSLSLLTWMYFRNFCLPYLAMITYNKLVYPQVLAEW